ncbi:MarR family winged helix-turn-helix transcriptional regulator [Nocardia amamiensis]|uniref:MarR family winged helix-turn-helix transcriptional regulator n=1 Tax=Nocardia amamiensis TaxID=404578 RepID=UPI0008352ED2|nr:MarR family winged helix-turn-helix transcriptional regulator [Nocardia amamiensis]
MAVPAGPVSTSTDLERLMFEFVDAYNHAFEAAAHEHAMSMAHACVLGRVGIPRGMGELAEELGCDASNITQIVTRLEARSLVQRQTNPEDRRSRQIQRTLDGDAVNAAFEESFDFPRRAGANLTPDEQLQLTELLRKALTAPQ